MVAILSVIVSSTDLPPISAALSASTSAAVRAALAMPETISWKSAFLATKSVSELISTATPLPPSTTTATRPSAAVRPDFLAALARPLVRSQSTAASMSPSVSVRAFLASIMPAPVLSRSSLTIAAVIAIVALLNVLGFWGGPYTAPCDSSVTAQLSAVSSAGASSVAVASASSATASSTRPSSISPRSTPAAPSCALMPSRAARAARSQ